MMPRIKYSALSLMLAIGVAWSVRAANPAQSNPTSLKSGANTDAMQQATQPVEVEWEAVQFVGREFWENNGDLILGRVTAVKNGDQLGVSLYDIVIVGNLRGTLNPGTVVTVELSICGGSPDPMYDKGNLAFLPTVPKPGTSTLWMGSDRGSPLGWGCPRLIPPEKETSLAKSLQTLRGIVPKHANDPLDRIKAIELLKSKDYETWAIGVSMLVAKASKEDVKLLTDLYRAPETDLLRATWITHQATHVKYGQEKSLNTICWQDHLLDFIEGSLPQLGHRYSGADSQDQTPEK